MGQPPDNMSLIREFWLFLMERKAWWITPIVVVTVLLAALMFFALQSAPAATPFIYTLF